MDLELANGRVPATEPVQKTRVGRKAKYPFAEVGVGQMFTFECSQEDRKKAVHRLSAAANVWCRRHGYVMNHFVIRTLPTGVGVYRIGGDDKPLEG